MIRAAILVLDDQGQTRTCSAESLVNITMQTSSTLDRLDQEIQNYNNTEGKSSFFLFKIRQHSTASTRQLA